MIYDRFPEGLIALGLALGGLIVVEVLAIATPPVRFPLGPGPTAAVMFTSLLLIGLLAGGGVWLRRGVLNAERYPRMTAWVVVSVGLIVPFFGFIVFQVRHTWLAQLTMLRWAATAGAGAGFLAGVFEARALDRAVATERGRVQNEALRRRNKRLDEFASILSHDLRNPLNVAMGYVENAREEHDDDSLAAAGDALDRMDTLVDETLILARSGKVIGEPAPLQLEELVEQCWINVPTSEATLEVRDAPTIMADPERLKHLFENLFRNAVEHGGPSVTVTVGAFADGFYVEDDGPGIPESERQNVVESGYTTTEEGTGFGLAIVRQIAEAHGWNVTVTKGEEGGARFEFIDVNLG